VYGWKEKRERKRKTRKREKVINVISNANM